MKKLRKKRESFFTELRPGAERNRGESDNIVDTGHGRRRELPLGHARF